MAKKKQRARESTDAASTPNPRPESPAKTAAKKAGAKRARYGRLDSKTVEIVLSLIRTGVPTAHAAAAAGIHRATWYRALKDSPELARDADLAESAAIASKIGVISTAAQNGNWTAAAWWLERRHPQDFARRDNLALSGGGVPVEHVHRIVYADAEGSDGAAGE